MAFSRLAAITYNDPNRAGQKLIRVYYQVGKTIRESSYDSENGWYVRGENTVANNAKTGSPIAATTQSGGKKVREDLKRILIDSSLNSRHLCST